MRFSIIFVFVFVLLSCNENSKKLFHLIPASQSGITFQNSVKESLEFNIFNYMYFYNGAGVATGDLNGDSLSDIYFVSNQQSNKLYLNKGNFKFEDITEKAGVAGLNGWGTGVTMADVNGDGRLDIYVGYVGNYLTFKAHNQLFINEGNDADGIPTFIDKSNDYGLDLVGFATQASFFDYDRDGDLDMFMLNHSIHQNGTFGTAKDLRYKLHPTAGDKLLRNDNNFFIDVTKQAGIFNSAIGYGLGVVVSDVNLDGWPDIYVGNDFHENDYLYINQHDGTFKESLEQEMNHTSRYTMGVDFADLNNDAFPDLVTLDMLPYDQIILKSSGAEDPYDVYSYKLNFGYNYQYSRNMLQLNQRNGTFSEIGQYSGVYATDWSWATLIADFDLDGYKDIFISNGILRRSNNLDYINFITIDSIQDKLNYNMSEAEVKLYEKMPKIKIPNFLFHNNRDSTFENKASEWGLNQESYSNGVAYCDLDNDGDLDLVVNNIDNQAFVYENKTVDSSNKSDRNNFVQFSFHGNDKNTNGIGTKVVVFNNKEIQMIESMPTRGYESSVDGRAGFGLGSNTSIDSAYIIWNTGMFEVLKNVPANKSIQVFQSNSNKAFDYSYFHNKRALFDNYSLNLPYRHKENKFVEFTREGLIPHMVSSEGPGIAIGDVNGDGLEDIYGGGAKWQIGDLFIQTKTGFITKPQTVFKNDSTYEDVDALFLDVDNDNDLDLIVVSGGNEFLGDSPYLNPRLYLNDGHANFSTTDEFKKIFCTGSVVRASDFDNDGDNDLFIGARAIPWKYGIKPTSYLLQNDGKGHFTDVTTKLAPFLKDFAFVKDAKWVDIDNDKDIDLIVAAEWSPILVILSDNGKFSPLALSDSGLENSEGWWNAILAFDFDGDGDLDMIAGNRGLNSKIKASIQEPVRLYVNDFDNNGRIEQILTTLVNGVEYPFYTRDEMIKQLPYLAKNYLSYQKYAEASVSQMFGKKLLEESIHYQAKTFASVYIENLGNNKFKMTNLPTTAQFSSTQSFLPVDYDHDNDMDILIAGNFFPTNIQIGRYDANFGVLLQNNGKGKFKDIPNDESGISIIGEVKKLQSLVFGRDTIFIAFKNNSTPQAFILQKDKN